MVFQRAPFSLRTFFYASYDLDSTFSLQTFSTVPKIMFRVSGGFYNIRALQRTSNQGHRMLRKKRNENEACLNSKDFIDFRIFKAFLNFLQLFFRTHVSSQAPLKFFYVFKNNVQSIWELLQHQAFPTHVESRS